MAHAGGDLGAVALDLHPPAAAVAELAARHVAVELVLGELEARGQALDDARQAGAVRLAGGDETERHDGAESMGERTSATVPVAGP